MAKFSKSMEALKYFGLNLFIINRYVKNPEQKVIIIQVKLMFSNLNSSFTSNSVFHFMLS